VADKLITDLADVQAGDMVRWTPEGNGYQFTSPAYGNGEYPGWLFVAGAVLRRPDGFPGLLIEFHSATREVTA
jgi:hypothetical protein